MRRLQVAHDGAVAAPIFPDVTTDAVRKSLRRLTDASYLIAYRENRMTEALHAVGPKGKVVLAAKRLEVEFSRMPPRQIEHMIGINDIRVAVEAEPSRVTHFQLPPELPPEAVQQKAPVSGDFYTERQNVDSNQEN